MLFTQAHQSPIHSFCFPTSAFSNTHNRSSAPQKYPHVTSIYQLNLLLKLYYSNLSTFTLIFFLQTYLRHHMSTFPNASGFYFKLFKVIKIQFILVPNIVLFCLKQTECEFFFVFFFSSCFKIIA